MKTIAQALFASLWLAGVVVSVASADDSDSTLRREDAQLQAYYDDGSNFFVSVFGRRSESSGGPFNLAQIVLADRASGQWSVCISENPSIRVLPSGQAELSFTPQIGSGCPSDAPVFVSCMPSDSTIISSGTMNTTYRGDSTYGFKVNHGNAWAMSNLHCSIVAFGGEYLAQSGYASLGRSVAVR